MDVSRSQTPLYASNLSTSRRSIQQRQTIAFEEEVTIRKYYASKARGMESAERENCTWSIRLPVCHPGKDIRSELIQAFNKFLLVPEKSLNVIKRVVGMLHTSSLLIDDVQDSSTLRRGVPVAHNIFGTAQTINSANYVYFLALKELQNLENTDEAIEIFTTELLNLHRGQGMDLYWRDTLTCPTEDDYLEMVQNKTGGLFRSP